MAGDRLTVCKQELTADHASREHQLKFLVLHCFLSDRPTQRLNQNVLKTDRCIKTFCFLSDLFQFFSMLFHLNTRCKARMRYDNTQQWRYTNRILIITYNSYDNTLNTTTKMNSYLLIVML